MLQFCSGSYYMTTLRYLTCIYFVQVLNYLKWHHLFTSAGLFDITCPVCSSGQDRLLPHVFYRDAMISKFATLGPFGAVAIRVVSLGDFDTTSSTDATCGPFVVVPIPVIYLGGWDTTFFSDDLVLKSMHSFLDPHWIRYQVPVENMQLQISFHFDRLSCIHRNMAKIITFLSSCFNEHLMYWKMDHKCNSINVYNILID